jgi:hypothetical protein
MFLKDTPTLAGAAWIAKYKSLIPFQSWWNHASGSLTFTQAYAQKSHKQVTTTN